MLRAVKSPIKSLVSKLPQPKLPDRLKGGLIEGGVKYLGNVAHDYKSVYLDTRQDMRNRPLRATVIGGVLLTLGYLMRTNPGEEEFIGQLVTSNNALARVPENLRNPDAYEQVYEVAKLRDEKLLRHQSLGFFSLIYREDNPPETSNFSAQCKYLRPSFKSYLTERIVDVGILNEYRLLKHKMIDYDISPEVAKLAP